MNWQTIHRFLAINKLTIEKLALAVELCFLPILAIGAWAIGPGDNFLTVYEIGKKFGELSLCFYMVTLLPGIGKRLDFTWTKQWATTLMLFRKHFGIMMFLSAITHFCFVVLFPSISFNQLPIFDPFKLSGLTALLLLLPLWLTSNDTSKRFLGKKWNVLHKLTYIAMFLIFAHVTLQLKKWAIPMGGVVILEVISGIKYWTKSKPQSAISNE
jgi:DMSO/TMAO reductase YedYZ heme-binding membrane subunit